MFPLHMLGLLSVMQKHNNVFLLLLESTPTYNYAKLIAKKMLYANAALSLHVTLLQFVKPMALS